MKSSPRPKARPGSKMAPKTSPRPKARPPELGLGPDYTPAQIERRSTQAMAKGGMVTGYAAGGKMKMVEKGGKKVPSFAADGVGKMAKGGMSKEGSAKDMREDKAMAKKAGLTMKQHEASAADVKHDKPSKMKTGGGVMRGAGAATRGKKFSGSF